MIKLKTFKSSLYCQQLLRLIKLFFKLTHYKSLFYKKKTQPHPISSQAIKIAFIMSPNPFKEEE